MTVRLRRHGDTERVRRGNCVTIVLTCLNLLEDVCADCVLRLEAEQDAGPRKTTHSEKCHRVKRVLKTGSVDTKLGKVTLLLFHPR